jgi:menaquinone-specific isochorismate synthase
MVPKNFKDFLTIGLCLQTGPESFKVLIGPFTLVTLEEIQASKSSTFLYKSEFWDFLKTGNSKAQNFVYRPREAFDLNREEIIWLLENQSAKTAPFQWQYPEDEDFKLQFEWSQNLFKKGVVKKTVPVICQSSSTSIDEAVQAQILLNLMKQKNFGWTYAYFENGTGMIGHTPELLLEWQQGHKAKTVALAGTLPNTGAAKSEILADAKIRQEHDFVIDDLQEKLKPFSPVIGETEALELRHLLHLQTPFSVAVKNISEFLDCTLRLHPTAAMGVYPYQPEVLKEMSRFKLQSQRGLFAAPLGIVAADRAQVVVPIRGLTFDRTGSKIYSGCGVTAESQYQSELKELENKRNSVKKMLGLTND